MNEIVKILMKAHPLTTLLFSICLWTTVIPISNLSAAEDRLDWVRSEVPAPDADGWITLFDGAKLHACEPDWIRSRMDRIGVSNGELWLDNSSVRFNVNARNLALRAIVKKVSGQNVALKCRQTDGRSYGFWFNGGGDFGIGMHKPQWTDITGANAGRKFPDYFQMELIAENSLITLKANDETLKAFEDHAIDGVGTVAIATNRGKSLFKKVQIKILDGPPPPPSWTSSEGKTIQAEFARLEGESVVVRRDGKEIPIPIAKLSLASRNQARDLAAKLPAKATNPAAPILCVTSLGKQEDPDHQRKLAESILSKKGRVDVWRGSGSLTVTRIEDLPKGKLSLKAISSVDGPFTDDDAALLNGCGELATLDIHRGTLTSLPLKSLSALTSLTLVTCRLNATTFREIRGNKNLLNFNAAGGHLEAEIVEILASCANLQNVNLEGCGIERVSLLPFRSLKLLRGLNVGGNKFNGEDLQGLAEIPSLDNLSLPNMDLTDTNLSFLPKLRTTHSLNLINCKVSSKVLDNVAAMPRLTRLELWNTNITDEMLFPLGGKRELEYLGLEHTVCTGEGFTSIEPFPNLRDLRLQGARTRLSDAGVLAIVKACPALRTLRLGGKHLSQAGLGSIIDLKQLSEIRLYEVSEIDKVLITSMAGMRKLTTLEISSSGIDDTHVALLEPMRGNLENLYLVNNRISDACMETFKKMKLLKELDISGTDVSKEAVTALRVSLPACYIRF